MHAKLIAAGFLVSLVTGGGLGCLLLAEEPTPPTWTTSSESLTPPCSPPAPEVVSVDASGAGNLLPKGAPEPEAVALGQDARPSSAEDPSDAIFNALARIEGQTPPPARAEIEQLLRSAFRLHTDWELQELAYAVERRVDPAGHRAHVLGLARTPSAPVGALIGATSSLTEVGATLQDTFLKALVRAQGQAATKADGLEAIQRRDLVQGAVADLIRRVSPYERVEWLLGSTGLERQVLAAELDRKGLLKGPQGLTEAETRRFVEALVRDAPKQTDLAAWGAELMLLVRLPRRALDTPALKAVLRKALASDNGAIRETARDLLGNDA